MADCHYRNHGNEGKHGTMLTMSSATLAAQVTMVTKINNHTSLYDRTARDTSVDPTSQVSSSAILLLLTAGKVRF
jgi:hypothetical protein